MKKPRVKLGTIFSQRDSILKQWLVSYLLVLAIPIIGAIIISNSSRNAIINEIVRANDMRLITIQASIDDILRNCTQISSNILMDKRLRDVINKSNSNQQIVETQGALIDLMWNYNSVSGLDLLLYIPEIDYVITPTTAHTLQYLTRSVILKTNAAVKVQDWRELLNSAYKNKGFFYSPYLSYDKFGYDALVFGVNTGQSAFSNCYDSRLYVSLQQDRIGELLDLTEGSAVLILDADRNVLAGFGKEIESFTPPVFADGDSYQDVSIDGERYIYLSKHSGTMGITYAMLVSYNEYWRSYNNVVIIIVGSIALALLVGFFAMFYLLQRNYSPVRSVLDMLKSGNLGDGNEFDKIRSYLHWIADGYSRMKSTLTRQHIYLSENYLYSALMGWRPHLSEDDIIEGLELSYHGKLIFPVSVFAVNTQESLLAFTDKTEMTDVTWANISLSFVIDNILGELLEDGYAYHKTEIENTTTFVFAISQEELQTKQDKIETALEKLCDIFTDFFKLNLQVVAGRAVESMDELPGSYSEIMAAHIYQLASSEKRVIRANRMNINVSRKELRYEEYASVFAEAVQYGAVDDALSIVDKFFGELNTSGEAFKTMRYHVFEFVNKLLYIPITNFKGATEAGIGVALDGLANCISISEMKQALVGLVELLCCSNTSPGSSVSVLIKSYVNENYSKSDLSLTMIANSMNLSVKYISKLFKMETGQGLLNYINAFRIQKAKEILAKGNTSIKDASEMVGYTAPKTFRRAFKNVEGVNPSEYMAVILKNENIIH